jgi:hypothetical protein
MSTWDLSRRVAVSLLEIGVEGSWELDIYLIVNAPVVHVVYRILIWFRFAMPGLLVISFFK